MKAFKFAGSICLRHLIGIGIAIIMIMPFYAMAENQQYLFSGITAAVAIALVYSCGWRYGFRDARKIKGFEPDKTLPVKASLIYTALPLIFIAVWLAAPDFLRADIPFMRGDTEFFIKDCYINGTPDFIYRMWQLAFAGFIPSGNAAAYFAMLIIDPVCVFIGYCVGLKRFSVMEYISAKLVFSSSDGGKRGGRKREDNFRR